MRSRFSLRTATNGSLTMTAEKIVYSTADLRNMFGVTGRTLRRWTKSDFPQPLMRGLWLKAAVDAWIADKCGQKRTRDKKES